MVLYELNKTRELTLLPIKNTEYKFIQNSKIVYFHITRLYYKEHYFLT